MIPDVHQVGKAPKIWFFWELPHNKNSQRKVVGTLWKTLGNGGQDLIPIEWPPGILLLSTMFIYFLPWKGVGNIFVLTLFTCFTAIIIPNKFTKNKQLTFQLNPTWISQRSSAKMSDLKVAWPFSPPICPIRVLSISRTSPCTNDSSLARNNLRKTFKRRKKRPRDLQQQQQQQNMLTDIEGEGTKITNARWIVDSHIIFVLDQWIPNYTEQLWWYWTVGSRSTEVGPFLCLKVDVGQLGASGGWYVGWCFAGNDTFLRC